MKALDGAPAACAHDRGRRLAALTLAVAATMAMTAARAVAAPSSAEIVAAVNAERAANAIPADIVEDATMTNDCYLHDEYADLNGGFDASNPHGETFGNPGFSSDGVMGGSHSVLSTGRSWADGDPFINAPYHLLQLMNPRLQKSGADEHGDGPYTCVWTATRDANLQDEARPHSDSNVLYSYPGPGRTGVPWFEYAAEYPRIPAYDLGLSTNQTHATAATGPNIFVYWDGPVDASHPALNELCAATIASSGPDTVDTRFVNFSMDAAAGSGSGVIVPAQPLRPATTYTVAATFSTSRPCDPSAQWTGPAFSFTTEPQYPAEQLMHVGDASPSPSHSGWIRIPFTIDDPLWRGTGKVTISTSSNPVGQTFTSAWWDNGYFELPAPGAGQWVKLTLANDSYSLGAVSWPAATVSRQFDGPPPAGGGGDGGGSGGGDGGGSGSGSGGGDGGTGSSTPTSGGTTTSTPTSSGAAPSNYFTISALAVSHGTVTVSLDVPGAGSVRAVETAKKLKVAKGSATAAGKGSLRLTLKPSRKAKKALARKGKLRVRLEISFTPAGGTTRTHHRSVLLRRR